MFIFISHSYLLFFSSAYLNNVNIPSDACGLLCEELWYELLHGESWVCAVDRIAEGADDYDDKIEAETISFLKKVVKKLWDTRDVVYITQNAYEFCHHVAILLKTDDVDRSLEWFRYCEKPSPPCTDLNTNNTAISKFQTLYVRCSFYGKKPRKEKETYST